MEAPYKIQERNCHKFQKSRNKGNQIRFTKSAANKNLRPYQTTFGMKEVKELISKLIDGRRVYIFSTPR